MITGIYQILNLRSNRSYIGSSKDINRRFNQYKRQFKNEKCHNKHLQRAFLKYGKSNFSFNILEVCDQDILFEREQYWIEQFNFKNLYNQSPTAIPNKGQKMSEETKLKIEHTLFKKGHIPKHKGTKGLRGGWKVIGRKGFSNPTYSYKFLSPEGTIYEGIGIRDLADKMNICPSGLYRLRSGKFKQYKGWTVAA